ncbi:hypothetical protein K2Z83_25340, partial [Oscillochloris sp. ZM17-4]|uniref:hypothetical protein n=1 Tax=Oscillochloris sp. ZM17-4 TaxID=2866714 RepID=UPI001C7329B5
MRQPCEGSGCPKTAHLCEKRAGKASCFYPVPFALVYWASCKNPLIVAVAQELEGNEFEPIGLINDEQFHPAFDAPWWWLIEGRAEREGVLDGLGELMAGKADLIGELPLSRPVYFWLFRPFGDRGQN